MEKRRGHGRLIAAIVTLAMINLMGTAAALCTGGPSGESAPHTAALIWRELGVLFYGWWWMITPLSLIVGMLAWDLAHLDEDERPERPMRQVRARY